MKKEKEKKIQRKKALGHKINVQNILFCFQNVFFQIIGMKKNKNLS